MSITLREALAIGPLKKARVVAGRDLDREITFVNIMEVPEVARWMKGGELLLTAGFAIKEDAELRRRLIFELAEKGVAAFGIKPGQYLDEVPADMIQCADKANLPLLELPRDVPYMDIMLPLFELMINDQLYRLKKAEEIHHKLYGVILSGEGVAGIAQALADLADNPVLIADSSGNLLSSSTPGMKEGRPEPGWEAKVLNSLSLKKDGLFTLNPHRWHRARVEAEDGPLQLVLVPVEINAVLSGQLLILERNRKLDEQDLMAMENASAIIALEFAKEKAVFETERRVRGELLEDLISGNFHYEESVIRRAGFMNFNLKTRLAAFVIDIDRFESYLINEAGRDENRIQELKAKIVQLAHASFLDYPGGAMLLDKSDSITGLVRLVTQEDARLLDSRLRKLKAGIESRLPRIKVSLGVGRSYNGVRYIKRSYEEALSALRIGRFMNGPAAVSYYEDLGPYRFLCELKDSEAVISFCQETVGKIITYDSQNNTEMLKTLISYFKNDCNLRRTSEDLFIHKNSVIYRVKKIGEITGLDMGDPEKRFNLQLSLKLIQVVGDQGPGGISSGRSE